MSSEIEVESGPLFTYKSEFTPPVYFIASMSNGLTIFEDNKPGIVRTWRRLKEYSDKKYGNPYITKLRIQTPHRLIECDGSDYRAFYTIGRIAKDLMRPDIQLESKIYAVLNNTIWDVHTIFNSENWAHCGFHKAYVREWLPENHSYLDLEHSISIAECGIVLNKISEPT